MGQVLDMLLSEAKDAFFVCEELGLQAKRALACTCSALRPVIFQLLRQPRLVVQEHDAIWDNARFVANVLMQSVPQQTLSVAGETCVPEMKLAHLRTLPRLKVGTMGPTAALFFGAAISDSDCVLRLSTGATKSIRVLRENDRINLQMPEIAQPSDRNAMLGALMLGAVRASSPVTHPSKRCKVVTLHHAGLAPWAVSMAMHVSRISGISVCHEALGSCLSLGRAGICDAGMMFLAPTLHRPHCMLSRIDLSVNSFGDKGLIALAPALRQLPALESLKLGNNRFGDEGLAALVPPPALPVGAPSAGVLALRRCTARAVSLLMASSASASLPPPSGVLTKLTELDLSYTQITDAGCATLVSALDSGMLPALKWIQVGSGHQATPACTSASRTAVTEALERATSRAARPCRRSGRFKVGATPS